MEWWLALGSGLALGTVGSLHCLGMCGPLLLSMPKSGSSWPQQMLRLSIYHLSRTWVYVILGIVVGLFGRSLQSFIPESFHRHISIGVGVFTLIVYWWFKPQASSRFTQWVSQAMKKWWLDKSYMGQWLLGSLNALLPCGMVYVALATALGTGSAIGAGLLMFGFGLGTSPLLMALSMLKGSFSIPLLSKVRWKGLAVYACSGLLILRGLALGIPFLSPAEGYAQAVENNSEAVEASGPLHAPCCERK